MGRFLRRVAVRLGAGGSSAYVGLPGWVRDGTHAHGAGIGMKEQERQTGQTCCHPHGSTGVRETLGMTRSVMLIKRSGTVQEVRPGVSIHMQPGWSGWAWQLAQV